MMKFVPTNNALKIYDDIKKEIKNPNNKIT